MAAGTSILMQIPGIEGSSSLKGSDPGKDGSHEGWIPIESCSFTFKRPVTTVDAPADEGEAPAAPSTQVEPITIKRKADRSTAQLLMWLANKEQAERKKETVLIDYCAPSGKYYVRYELEGVEVVSSTIGFTEPDDLSESLTITYEYITIFLRPFDISGEVAVESESFAEYEVFPQPE